MEIRIPIHSIIAVITNSSTEIFVGSTNTSIEMAKGILQDIINIGGGHKNVDDIFEFEIINDGEENWSGFTDNELIITIKSNDPDEVKSYGNIARRFLNLFDINACQNG